MGVILEIINIILKVWLLPKKKAKIKESAKNLFCKYETQIKPIPLSKYNHVNEFIFSLGIKIALYCVDSLVFPSMAIAQACLESGYNKDAKTLYGVKATGWKGDTLTVATTEYYNNKKENVKDKFRAYDSVDESIKDYIKLLQTCPWFRDVVNAQAVKVAVHGLQNDDNPAYKDKDYATDPNYEKKINSIIDDYDLRYFDTAKEWIIERT